MTTKINWNDENTATLVSLAGEGTVTQEQLISIANEMGTTPRSIGAKLRRLDFDVEKAAAKASAWSEEQATELRDFVTAHEKEYTFAEIAASFGGGSFTAKQIQGKLLSMELFGMVRKTEKVAVQRTYTESEEVRFVELAVAGATMEALAEAFAKPIASVRGKALSLLKSKHITSMPIQETSAAKKREDIFEGLDVANMTVEQLAEKTEKSDRGIKTTLSRRGITCSDYDGAAKRAKIDAKD